MEKIALAIFSAYEFLCTVIISVLLLYVYANNASIAYTAKVDIPKEQPRQYS